MTSVDLAFTSTQFELQWEIPRYLIQQKPAALQYLKKKDLVHWACAVRDLVSMKKVN